MTIESFEIKDGRHKRELGIVLETWSDGRKKVLTLEGDIHYYDQQGYEFEPLRNRFTGKVM